MRWGNRLPSVVLRKCDGEALNLKFSAFGVEFEGRRLGVVPMLFRRRGPVSTVNILPIGCIGPLIRGEALRAGLVGELLAGVERFCGITGQSRPGGRSRQG